MEITKDYLKEWTVIKVKGSERTDLFRQIYSFYDTTQEENHRKRANWKRYIQYLKENKLRNSKETMQKFKKSKSFLRKITAQSMAIFWLNHVLTPDLYYVLSVVKDKSFRNESVGGYICSLYTDKKFSTDK